MRKRMMKQLVAILLSAVMVATLLPMVGLGSIVTADTAWNKTIAGLGSSGIKAPAQPTSPNDVWTGSYVWYGTLFGRPIKYRVLAPQTTRYGSSTMFLDCDSYVYQAPFDDDQLVNSGSYTANDWKNSDLKKGLNGDAFLTAEGCFSDIERNSIANSTISSHPLTQGTGAFNVSEWSSKRFGNSTALTGEKLFVLDIEEVSNILYGYYNNDLLSYARAKKSTGVSKINYWLRSAYINLPDDETPDIDVGMVFDDGAMDFTYVDNMSLAVSPAFNVDLSSILFNSCVSGKAGQYGAEYKLTLTDSNLTVKVPSGKTVCAYGNTVMVPYSISGSDASKATQVSVLILNKEYKAGNTNNASVIYYGKLNTNGAFSTSGTGMFILPSDLSAADWGSKYQVYLLAEDVNAIHETDYASSPVKIAKPSQTGTSTISSATAKYSSIVKTTVQEFEVKTSTDVKYLMLYSENAENLVKTWSASENSSVSGSTRTWKVSQPINSAGNRNLVFLGGTTADTPATNAAIVSFKVEKFGVLSASAKNAAIQKGGEQVFTVKTTAESTRLVEYAEDGKTKVNTWTASASNSTVSGNVRTWTVSQNIQTAGKRNLIFKAGDASTLGNVQKTAAFTVEETWVDSASVGYTIVGKGGTESFTVKTPKNAKYLMLYAEGGNLVKTWEASGNSTVSGDVRTWNVTQAIHTPGSRKLTLKAGTTTTPSALGKTVSFTVIDKKVQSVKVKNASILQGTPQEFTVITTSDIKYLMLYAEDGYLVKTWQASGNSTETPRKLRTWTVSLTIGTPGDRTLTFKGGTTSNKPVTNARQVSFRVENGNIISITAKYAAILAGSEQIFTVKTTKDTTKLVEYAEDGKTLVQTWTASTDNSIVDGNERTWTLRQYIRSAGNRNLIFMSGNETTMSPAKTSVRFTVLSSVPVNATYFPDEFFRAWIAENADTDGDGVLSGSELKREVIQMHDMKIKDLSGVEFFPSLKALSCYSSDVNKVDVSRNLMLQFLDLDGSRIRRLDLSNNVLLYSLDVSNNDIVELKLSNRSLVHLYCNNNDLTSLNVENCPSLEILDCNDNYITSLDLNKNTRLTQLHCQVNGFTSLDLSHNTALTEVTVSEGVNVTGADSSIIQYEPIN